MRYLDTASTIYHLYCLATIYYLHWGKTRSDMVGSRKTMGRAEPRGTKRARQTNGQGEERRGARGQGAERHLNIHSGKSVTMVRSIETQDRKLELAQVLLRQRRQLVIMHVLAERHLDGNLHGSRAVVRVEDTRGPPLANSFEQSGSKLQRHFGSVFRKEDM